LRFSIRRHLLFFVGIFAPAVLLVGPFIIYPVLDGARLSFTDATPLRPNLHYVGLENFVLLFEDPEILA
jgi:multiple sugar transport system permease protein